MSSFIQQQPLILASGSAIRLKLMRSLGLEFLVIPSHCDEDAIKKSHAHESILELGYTLASSKALEVSARYPDHYVIAADQLCVIGKQVLDKPLNHTTAVEHLTLLSGQEHQQISCLCIAKGQSLLWQYHDIAKVTLHHLSDERIEAYLRDEKPYHSCGAYQFETKGKWLFNKVDGKEDTILGLPLVPLANALLSLGVVRI